MFRMTPRPLLGAAVAAALLITSAAPLGVLAQDDKKKADKEAAKSDASKQPNKQEREYQKIRQFSVKRYGENPEFRDEVDEAYCQKQREHSEYAFNINTLDQEDEQVVRSGERFRILDTLYDNPLAQDYVNRVGQSLVPNNSQRLYAFKITLNPIPEARSLSTGSVYISTGLLAQIDNEAQLAYILGHEIGHIERDHWREDVLVQHGLEEYNEKQQQGRRLFSSIANVGSRVVSGGFLNAGNMMGLTASLFVQAAVPTLVKMAVPNAVVTWDKQQEDEADQLGLQYMLARSYDPREVPKLYQALQRSSQRDRRAGLGFMASAARVAERIDYLTGYMPVLGPGMQTALMYGAVNLNVQQQTEKVLESLKPAPEKQPDTGKLLDPSRDAANRAAAAEKLIAGEMSEEIRRKLEAGEIIGSTAEFLTVMAELKRDNGIRAYYYDMFRMSRDNLEESLQIRSNDPFAHFYYGKILKLTARTQAEKSRALAEFAAAIQLDRRRVLPEAYLHRALALAGSREGAQTREIVADLKEYVTLYQKEHSGALPPNMDVIYDYMQDAGELTWSATPAVNVSTKNIEPIGVAMGSPQRTAAPAPQPSPQPEPTTAPQPKPQPARGGTRRP